MNVLWVQDGQFGIGLAEGISGLFPCSFFFEGDRLDENDLGYLVGRVDKQKVTLVILVKSPLAMKKKFGGTAFMAYGSTAKMDKDVIIRKPENSKDERGATIEFLRAELKAKKIIVGP